MKNTTACLLTVAVAGLFCAGCQTVDESAPSRPRIKAATPDEKNQENAEKRVLEAPKRDMPTAGSEFPGQSRANDKSGRPVLTLADNYGTNDQGDPLPYLPEKPGMTPASGYTPVPGTPWVIEHSWGESLPLKDYNHRAWPETKTHYEIANEKQNPTYVVDLPADLPMPKCQEGKDVVTTLAGVPWFYGNVLAMPLMMCFENPWQQETSARLGQDPQYFGYLPSTGAVVPSPSPGEFKFDYNFEADANTPSSLPATAPLK